MLSSSFLFLQATTPLSMAGHPVESLALRRVPGLSSSTVTHLSTYATARWMLGIFSTRRSLPSTEINLVDRPEDPYGRTELSSSVTTKACGNPKESPKLLPFLQPQPALATSPRGKLPRTRTSCVS